MIFHHAADIAYFWLAVTEIIQFFYVFLGAVYTIQIYPGKLQKRINICPY